jgi:hypothetical protein
MARHLVAIVVVGAVLALWAPAPPTAEAEHSWNGYHWARTANPFTLLLGDNLNETWSPYLRDVSTRVPTGVSIDWSKSDVLDTMVVSGKSGNAKRCQPTRGRNEICNASYGDTGWFGQAALWLNGQHITQATVKLNDYYFDDDFYDDENFRRRVLCQEVGHTLGLDHQVEAGALSCMNEDGGAISDPNYISPNAHDFEQLEIIYEHLDSTSTVGSVASRKSGATGTGLDSPAPNRPADLGRTVGYDAHGRANTFEKDLGGGHKLLTHIYLLEPGAQRNNKLP